MTSDVFPRVTHEVDVCVVGGGMAGFCAALSAARRGAKVVMMQDRPVLGGNASSECRVHIQGADRHNGIKNMRETGILEEVRMENLYRNPNKSFGIWDTILYEKLAYEPNITLLLNCSCLDAEMDSSGRIVSVTGWQLTTQTYMTVRAKVFADCSGDGILAPLTGAEWRMGREARDEFGESIAPEVADDKTMGMSICFQTREYDTSQPFEPPKWAEVFESCDELPGRDRRHKWWTMGYWWVELGGEDHSIHDTERLRDELLRISYGIWDHIKNRCQHSEAAANWSLDWMQFLPAKRESRRFVGDHILSQVDVDAEGRFDDLVAYGGWTMDDHHPAGFRSAKLGEPPTIFHQAPCPYGIPYRSLYSKNIANLMFAGRNASCTHAAMSSTRVMGTCSSMGQAVGTAAAMAVEKTVDPRGMLDHMAELQQALIDDDCYLPWIVQDLPELTKSATLAASAGDPEPVRDGINRPVGEDIHGWDGAVGDTISYMFGGPQHVEQVTLIIDSGLDQTVMMSYHQADDQLTAPPDVMAKAFRVEGLVDGEWQEIATLANNHQRHVRLPVGREVEGVRFALDATWGAERSRVYAFIVE
jgi:FAD-dependent oxidoreductase family protein